MQRLWLNFEHHKNHIRTHTIARSLTKQVLCRLKYLYRLQWEYLLGYSELTLVMYLLCGRRTRKSHINGSVQSKNGIKYERLLSQLEIKAQLLLISLTSHVLIRCLALQVKWECLLF